MTLSPRAIALQGMGFAPLLVAVQGLASASPFKRAPKGAGYGARPVWGMRPVQAATVRAGMANTTRPALAATSRAPSPNTTRPRR
jgi:hypothetical protein